MRRCRRRIQLRAPPGAARPQPRPPPRDPISTANADWRTFLRSTGASPWPLRARPASSPGNRGRSCRLGLSAVLDSPPLAEEAVDLCFAGIRTEAHADQAAGDVLGP